MYMHNQNTMGISCLKIIILCVRIACGIPKATGTHSEYATLIAFPLQQRLLEHVSMLRYTPVFNIIDITAPKFAFVTLYI